MGSATYTLLSGDLSDELSSGDFGWNDLNPGGVLVLGDIIDPVHAEGPDGTANNLRVNIAAGALAVPINAVNICMALTVTGLDTIDNTDCTLDCVAHRAGGAGLAVRQLTLWVGTPKDQIVGGDKDAWDDSLVPAMFSEGFYFSLSWLNQAGVTENSLRIFGPKSDENNSMVLVNWDLPTLFPGSVPRYTRFARRRAKLRF